MKVYYCDGWFRVQKRAVELWTPERAREAYDARELYAALIGDKDRPSCFVECDGDYIGVEFLDEHLRSDICYQFQEQRPGMLFLSMAVFRRFDGESDKVNHGVVYYFETDGKAVVDKEDRAAHQYWEATATLNVAANWEPFPAFGEYESITRLDRGLDLVH